MNQGGVEVLFPCYRHPDLLIHLRFHPAALVPDAPPAGAATGIELAWRHGSDEREPDTIGF